MEISPGKAPKLSFITLLSYDYRYALRAIRSFYQIADEIILGLDADRVTWKHNPFEIDMFEVNGNIRKFDSEGKVRVVEGNFHKTEHPSVNETRERAELSLLCDPGNWIVQIDCDEMLLNPGEFRDWLFATDPKECVLARWISIFKIFGQRALVIHPATEWAPVATRLRGQYTVGRWTAEKSVESPLQLLHFSWGRSRDELRQKLENWGHAGEFDIEAFLRFWDSVTLDNYQQFRDFHPIQPGLWPSLTVGSFKWADGT
ncbi:MAG: hypothetical protein ABSF29_06410 [Tepidisphaeraceae bacterium]|jgi:hypothetical protein